MEGGRSWSSVQKNCSLLEKCLGFFVSSFLFFDFLKREKKKVWSGSNLLTVV